MKPMLNLLKPIGALCLIALWSKSAIAQAPPTNQTTRVENEVVEVANRVESAKSGTENWVPAPAGQILRVKDRLRTGMKSRATLRLSNQSLLRLNQLTTIEIQPPPTEEKRSILDLKKGAAYFYNRETPVETEFRTPLASGAIRGTEFHLEVAEDGRTTIALVDGAVNLSNSFGQTNLVSGEMGVVEPGKAPTKTAMVEVINIIQWALYYPGVLDLSEIELKPEETQTLTNSLAAYWAGDLLRAVSEYPTNRTAASVAEKIYSAALLLAVGQVGETEAILKTLPVTSSNSREALLAGALREIIAAVKNQSFVRPSASTLATEWLAESYYLQTRLKLEEALQAARKAVEKSPAFGFGWVRVAELEFSFGRTKEALAALEKGLQYGARNAQALSLKGFLLAAQGKIDQAFLQFDEAIHVDGGLGNAWLGRGLCRIRKALNFFSFDLASRSALEGRQDLQAAAALEPHRAILRSYLSKAFLNEWDMVRASKEIDLAKKLDSNDPTSWLYSALLNQQMNKINEGVKDLEKSKELNDNRGLFRSRMLLDQDQAVRSANLAALYRDAGMTDLSVREASRAVNGDYANYSAHLFLANSYDALRDPKGVNLRYEAPWLSELLLANLLSPVGAGNLSRNISQQEYSPLLERNRLGISSQTEYRSTGEWYEKASQFGNLGSSSYAVDTYYHADNGSRANNDLESFNTTVTFKQQLTAQDTLLLQGTYGYSSVGDLNQYYNQASAVQTFRGKDRLEPIVFAGYHHEWGPGVHTLFLAGRFNDTTLQTDSASGTWSFKRNVAGAVVGTGPNRFDPSAFFYFPTSLNYRSELEGYSSEIQQIWQQSGHTTIAGARFQTSASATTSETKEAFVNTYSLSQQVNPSLQRINVYLYHQWQIIDPLQITAGISYDDLQYPKNIDYWPLSNDQLSKNQVSPKVGLTWTPFKDTHLRGAYTHSLGGVYFDQSLRLEPTQISGFNQAYRSMIPESFNGSIAGSRFKTADVALDHQWPTHTYASVQLELLESQGERYWGAFDTTTGVIPSSTPQRYDYEEKSILFNVNQLLGDEWSLGANYRLTHSDMKQQWLAFSASTPVTASSTIHQITPYIIFNHRCGFFSQLLANWNLQNNADALSTESGANFWQLSVFGGYRFLQRRAEVRLGVINLTDRDYQLDPLTLYSELPRVRTFVASLKLNF